MATMIPNLPKEFDPRSQEGIIFDELNRLPDEYYVFHSFDIVSVVDNVITESETDFVIFHPKKGIICLEAKAGQVQFGNGYWQYGSGKRMKHDGPYNQAKRNKWFLSDYMNEHGLEYENEHCKKIHAVWFPDVPTSRFEGQHLPGGGDLRITLTSDAFGHIEEKIEELFKYEGQDRAVTCLSEKETKRILERVLAPTFKVISIQEVKRERTELVYKRMLDEQVALLEYLQEQNNAIINGLAGTGKTMMAVKKAQNHSNNGEEVLFLCYNSFLKEHLKKVYDYPHVHYYTIDGLACKLCDTPKPEYDQLKSKLEEMYCEGNFPYQHVIIDEGQDFGKDELTEEKLIDLLKMNAIDNEERKGTFYLFYDMNQMIQANRLPQYIKDADCKLTLYRNCRNTENIAVTSLRLLGSKKMPKLNVAVPGDNPEMGFASGVEETVALLNSEIDKFLSNGFTDITVLTCKTEESSIVNEYCHDSKYVYKRGYIRFTTCRKFKGLESEVIIVLDIDRDTFDDEQGEQLMYVGSSRARHKLSCIVNMTEAECIDYMNKAGIKYNRNVYKSFATAFNAKVIQNT